MARLIKPLTATQVQNAKPRETMYKMFDGGGLFLQVNPPGGKHWKMKYTKDSGKEGLLTFGAYPDVSLEQARRMRDEARAQKAAGVDPGEARRREKEDRRWRAGNTFEAVGRAWMDVYSSKVTPQTMRENASLLERYAFPAIGRTPIRDLKAPDFLPIGKRGSVANRSGSGGELCFCTMRFDENGVYSGTAGGSAHMDKFETESADAFWRREPSKAERLAERRAEQEDRERRVTERKKLEEFLIELATHRRESARLAQESAHDSKNGITGFTPGPAAVMRPSILESL